MSKKLDRLGLRLSPELRARLLAAALAQDVSGSWLARRLIEEGLARLEEQCKPKPKRKRKP
jgi:hypothetical protein